MRTLLGVAIAATALIVAVAGWKIVGNSDPTMARAEVFR